MVLEKKYDNPLYEINYDPWDKFITLIEILNENYDIPSLYLYSSEGFVTNILNEDLTNAMFLCLISQRQTLK